MQNYRVWFLLCRGLHSSTIDVSDPPQGQYFLFNPFPMCLSLFFLNFLPDSWLFIPVNFLLIHPHFLFQRFLQNYHISTHLLNHSGSFLGFELLCFSFWLQFMSPCSVLPAPRCGILAQHLSSHSNTALILLPLTLISLKEF